MSFSFETVMSHPSKIQFLEEAKALGYRTYLYFVCTANPEINCSRVAERVRMGGHDVPREKILNRYSRSLDLLSEAVQQCRRAYIFDNTSEVMTLVVSVEAQGDVFIYSSEEPQIPLWVADHLIR